MNQVSLNKHHFVHNQSPLCELNQGKLAGLRHRTVIDSRNGADSLALWQEEHLPGFHVPAHLHDCEEIITVVSGAIEAELEGDFFIVNAGESFLIPAWRPHGFRVVSGDAVRLLAIFGNSNPKIFKVNGEPSLPPWEGGTAKQFDEEIVPHDYT